MDVANTNINRLPVMDSSMTFVPLFFFSYEENIKHVNIWESMCEETVLSGWYSQVCFLWRFLGVQTALDDYMTGSKWQK